jgi:hypothetical protein
MRSFKLLLLFSTLSLFPGCIFGVDAETAQNDDGWTIQAENDTGVDADIDSYTDSKDRGLDSEVYADAEDTYETDIQPPMDTDVKDGSDTRDVSDTQDGGEVDTDTNCSPTNCPAPSNCAKGVEGIDKCGSSGCQCVKYTGACERVKKGVGRTISYEYDSLGRKKKMFDSNKPNVEWRYTYPSQNSRCPSERKKYRNGTLQRTDTFTCKNGRIQKLDKSKPSKKVIVKYFYNSKGWLKKQEEYREGSKVDTRFFSHDPVGNITDFTRSSSGVGYRYDYGGCQNNKAP